MDLFESRRLDMKILKQEIEEAIHLIKNLRAENRALLEKNRELEEEKKSFYETKKNMEKRIRKLIEKLSAIEE